MPKRNPEEYVILIVRDHDLSSRDPILSENVRTEHFRWTRADFEQADRVDFLDRKGKTRTLKERPYHDGQRIVTVGRPESFLHFDIQMPWAPDLSAYPRT